MADDEPLPRLTLAELEAWYVRRALAVCRGNISAAARWLGLARSSLQRKLRRLGLRPPASPG